MKAVRNLLIALTTMVVSQTAFACGDTLYRVGKGVSYRVYTAPLPGKVLVYGQAKEAVQLAEALSQSGHGVRLVETEVELALEMGKTEYDVVIAAYSEHSAVEAYQQNSDADFIPVVWSKEEEKIARQSYDQVLVANRDNIKHYLKAIHKSLKARV